MTTTKKVKKHWFCYFNYFWHFNFYQPCIWIRTAWRSNQKKCVPVLNQIIFIAAREGKKPTTHPHFSALQEMDRHSLLNLGFCHTVKARSVQPNHSTLCWMSWVGSSNFTRPFPPIQPHKHHKNEKKKSYSYVHGKMTQQTYQVKLINHFSFEKISCATTGPKRFLPVGLENLTPHQYWSSMRINLLYYETLFSSPENPWIVVCGSNDKNRPPRA